MDAQPVTVNGLAVDHLTTDQYNFCRAVDAMKLDLIRSGKEPGWLIAHPGEIALTWGETPVELCGLRVVEVESCRPGRFYVTHQKPDSA